MNGNSALEGHQPPSADGTASQLEQYGIAPGQNGINALTAGDLSSVARNFYSHAEKQNWLKTKGNMLTYGMSVSAEIVLGLKSTMIAGFKTAIDMALNRTHDFCRIPDAVLPACVTRSSAG